LLSSGVSQKKITLELRSENQETQEFIEFCNGLNLSSLLEEKASAVLVKDFRRPACILKSNIKI